MLLVTVLVVEGIAVWPKRPKVKEFYNADLLRVQSSRMAFWKDYNFKYYFHNPSGVFLANLRLSVSLSALIQPGSAAVE